MNNFYIKSTGKCPNVCLDKSSGLFEISGQSIPQNGQEFYKQTIQWLTEYVEDPLKTTTFTFNYTYFNTATSVFILKIILLMHKIDLGGKEVNIKWYYPADNLISKEMGSDFKDSFDLDFDLIPVAGKS